MKTFLLILALLVLFLINAKAQVKSVEINASALMNDKSTSDYYIKVYEDGKLKDSIFCKKSKPISISLESNKVFSIVFKKENYPERFVIVDTKVPKGLRDMSEDPFELQIELSTAGTSVKQDLHDFPVAILTINKKEKSLMASENYHHFTHN
jgi:hypothetical protein